MVRNSELPSNIFIVYGPSLYLQTQSIPIIVKWTAPEASTLWMWLLKVEGWGVTRQAESNVGTGWYYLCLFSNATTPSEHKSEGNSPINYHLHAHLVLVTTWHGIGDNFMALFMTAESFLMAPESSPSHRYYIWNQVTLKAHWMECFPMTSNS